MIKINKRIGYVLATGFTAGALAVGSVAWACTPQNGVTVLSGSTGSYARGAIVQGHAEYVTSVGLPGDANWKLYMGSAGMWCMEGQDYLKAINPTPYAYNSTGRVPAVGEVSGPVPSDAPLGTVDICMNNGDGYGNTATPVSVTITRR